MEPHKELSIRRRGKEVMVKITFWSDYDAMALIDTVRQSIGGEWAVSMTIPLHGLPGEDPQDNLLTMEPEVEQRAARTRTPEIPEPPAPWATEAAAAVNYEVTRRGRYCFCTALVFIWIVAKYLF